MASENESGGTANAGNKAADADGIDANDPLGYGAYADALWARIDHALNRSTKAGAELGDDPLVVGIFGEWGAGKSYLLNQIRARAMNLLAEQKAQHALDPGDTLTVPVWFQPWKYEHEEFLHVPLLLHVMNALKDALREPPSVTRQLVEAGATSVAVAKKIAKPTGKLLSVTKAIFPIVQKLLGSISVFGVKIDIPDEWGEWLETAADAAESADGDEEKEAKLKAKTDAKGLVPTATRDGLFFYRIHELLAALTRPGQYAQRKDLFADAKVTKSMCVNFVIFVDDLDRCLPEKAVAVLELIKTIFNVESFAFVLALDDEVIERGIGHRYSDYVLKDKKPQMPITGFEYLEKIVHVPFRIPSMTRDDALRFLQLKEKEVIGRGGGNRSSDKLWFSPRSAEFIDSRSRELADSKTAGNLEETGRIRDGDTSMSVERLDLHLAHLVLASFDAYVPRKLHRVVELFHQVAAIAAARKRPLATVLGGDADVRIVMALVLLQLFQPELYRCLKRTGEGFDVVRNSFLEQKLSSSLSDQDLLDWVCYGSETREIEEVRGDLTAVMAFLPKLSVDKRHPAQRIRLPIVECLLEHRSVQRHVFDPLKLFAALKASGDVAPFASISMSRYYSLLTVDPIERGEAILPIVEVIRQKLAPTLSAKSGEFVTTGAAVTLTVGRVIPASDVHLVFTTLISAEESEQRQVAVRAGLGEYDQLLEVSAAQIYPLVEKWLNESNEATVRSVRQRQLLRGLRYFANHLTKSSATLFWGLVKNAVSLPTQPNQPQKEPVVAALCADVRALLKQDDRFDEKHHFLLKDRFNGHTPEQEPIPGFVLIPAGPFRMGHDTEAQTNDKGETTNRNPSREVEIAKPFYVARTLTTVDQFALFVDDEDYVDAVRTGARGDAKKAGENWRTPRDWVKQREFGNRPAVGVNWFQARAYARWLDARLRQETDSELEKLSGYEVRLPNEAQWERAARATGLGEADVHTDRWPYSATEETLKDFANIRGTGIEPVSSVGVFPPTAIGLADIVGNAWQWMDNEYLRRADDRFPAVTDDAERAAMKAPGTHSMTLRGGSWINLPEHASCSSRLRIPPVDWVNDVGFRVVLSLPQKA